MAKPQILDPGCSYTFQSYFEMTYDGDLDTLVSTLIGIMENKSVAIA